MPNTKKGRLYLLILLVNLFFSVSAVTFGFFPYLGFSLSIISFVTLAFFIKEDKNFYTKAFLVISLILAAAISVRGEEFITFLNMITSIFFGFLMLADGKYLKGILTTVSSPIQIILRSFFTKSDYTLDLQKSNSTYSSVKASKNLISILITILVLFLVLPLLSAANPIFRNIVVNILNIFNFSIPDLGVQIVEWCIRLVFFFGLTFIIPKIATFMNLKKTEILKYEDPKLNLMLPKIVTQIVLVVFFITQLQLYFSNPSTLSQMGYSYSQYAREVFAQLIGVAAVVFMVLYNDSSKQKINRMLTYSLVLSSIFLVFMAYKSAYEYSFTWGFTYKRLYGFAVATWVLGTFVIYLNGYIKNQVSKIIPQTLLLTGTIIFLINLVNFDYLIYNYRKSTTGSGIDYYYLARLSYDSQSLDEQIKDLENRYSLLTENDKSLASAEGALILINKVEYLQEKYEKLDIRGFNILEFKQYLKVKDIDISSMRSKYTVKYPSIPTTPLDR